MLDARHRCAPLLALAALVPSVCLADLRENDPASMTTLDRYVAEPDDAFAWTLHDSRTDASGTTYVLALTSQSWRSAGEVSHPLWTHWLHVCVPTGATHDTALLIIAGGRRRDQPSFVSNQYLSTVASSTNSVVALLDNVPNQPLELNADGTGRSEDDLLAESWTTAFKTNDAGWVAHLAMVNSAVRAMDAIQQFTRERAGDAEAVRDAAPQADQPPEAPGADGGQDSAAPVPAIERFVVLGGSKRGWTAWLTAAVDARVRAIVPVVIDTLNLPETIPHHWGAYGFFSPAIHDYADRALMKYMKAPSFDLLRSIVDPFVYRARLTMPKLVLNAAGDEYFLPDSPKYWYHEIPGENRLYVVPNTDHGRAGIVGYPTMLSFYWAVINDRPIPELQWQLSPVATAQERRSDDLENWRATRRSAQLLIDTPEGYGTPVVTLWRADNASARDFREEAIGQAWTSTTLKPAEPTEPTRYLAVLDAPEQGFRAYLATVTMSIEGAPMPFTLSTEVFVMPDVLPFADKPME